MLLELKFKQTSTKYSANRDHPTPTDVKFTQLMVWSGLVYVSQWKSWC